MLAEFVEYYNTERPHRSLVLDTPRSAVRPAAGLVQARPVLGGLDQVNERAGSPSTDFSALIPFRSDEDVK